MPESQAAELVALADDEQSVVLRVLQGERFSSTDRYDALHAEIVVSSEFINGHIDLYLDSYDLESWSRALDSIESGRKATWLESGRSPRIIVTPPEISESECTEVSVFDVTGSQIIVTVPIAAPTGWIETHRSMLESIRGQFPLTL